MESKINSLVLTYVYMIITKLSTFIAQHNSTYTAIIKPLFFRTQGALKL